MAAAATPAPRKETGPRYDAAVERLTNLTFALQGAAQSGGNPDRSADWIHANVAGYHENKHSFRVQLQRDVATLARAGVYIDSSAGDGADGPTYRLNPESYQLPEVSFSPQEATVLGIASEVGREGGLGALSTAGWTKLAASGAHRDIRPGAGFIADNDITRLDPEVLRAILTGVAHKLRVTFYYQHHSGAQPQRRTMDLWGLVPRRNRLYVVGWDVDRQAERSFRSTRISDIRRSRQAATHTEPSGSLRDIVEKTLAARDTVNATIRTRRHAAPPLEQAASSVHNAAEHHAAEHNAADNDGDVVLTITGADRDWLLRTCAAYAAEAVVETPVDLREQVYQLLQKASQG